MHPWEPRLHYNYGCLLIKQGNAGEAIRHLRESLQLSPDYAYPHDKLAQLFAEQGRLSDAIWHWGEAVRLDPTLVVAHVGLARLFAV